MKNSLLIASFLTLGLSLNGQNRLSLYEEFTGENCPPCASVNPGLMQKINANPDVLIIKYQVPIPSAGPIYYQNTSDVIARYRDYYGVRSAPWGQLDGKLVNNQSNPYYLTAAQLTAAAAVPTDFSIDISAPLYDANNKLEFDIDVTATGVTSTSNTVLHVVLVESLHYDQPPGTNGEKDFHHVVRKMYPSPSGQAMPANWTANQVETISMSVDIPQYVDKSADELFIVAWLQNNATKEIYQAGKSINLPPIPIDLASSEIAFTNLPELLCGEPTGLQPTITLKNLGSEPITSAKIFYRAVSTTPQPWLSQDWTGSLAPNAEEDVMINTGFDGFIGRFFVEDSVALPNNIEDINPVNNKSQVLLTAIENQNGRALPIFNNFERDFTGWTPFAQGNETPLHIYGLPNGAGYNGSSLAALYQNHSIQSGESGYLILPFADLPAGEKALDFQVAYAQIQNENDKLEVVYTEDCGDTWVTVWSKAGSDLKTVNPKTSIFLPTNNSEWREESVDVSAIPNGSQIAFRATSNGGNNMFIDDVNLRVGPVNIEAIVAHANFDIYPNPVGNQLNVSIHILKETKTTFSITNVLGQQIIEHKQVLRMGQNEVSLNTSSLTEGIYFLNIITPEGSLQKKFVK